MKFSKVLLAAVFSFFFIGLNAQFFAGGNFRFSMDNNKSQNGTSTLSKSSEYAFNFSPDAGKFISDKLAIGLSLNISHSQNKAEVSAETISKMSTFGVSPFLRYYAIKWNKFSVFGQGNIGFDYTHLSQNNDGSTVDGPNYINTYISFYPGLSYDIGEKLSLETSLNFLSAAFNYNLSKHDDIKGRALSFDLGAGLDNIKNVGNLTIGAIFKF